MHATEKKMAERIPEPALIVPALELLNASPDGEMPTTDLIAGLENSLGPKGEDNAILDGRHDTKFSQKVRNLKSHKTLERRGLAERTHLGFRITAAGRNYLKTKKG
jgi:hypothetical protein